MYPTLDTNSHDEFRWWINALYATIKKGSKVRYTKSRFIKEIIIAPEVIYRKIFSVSKNKWIK